MSSQFLQVALDAVKAAESVILQYLDQDVRAELKPDESPVTIADKQAEEIIRQKILERFPDHTFYGEEGSKVDLASHHGYTWIIDPIDGTKSYIRKNPLFATQLALMHDGELILGVSNSPLLKELMYAEKGEGCYLNGERIQVSDVAEVKDAYLSHGATKYFVQSGLIEPLLDLAANVRWARGIGDFWSYHLLAQGKLDVMVEAETKLWDIAALTVIVREAGGRVTQIDGGEINQASTHVLATNGAVHDLALSWFAMKPPALTKVVAGCVVQQDDKYLMVQERQPKVYGMWNLPAGRVDAGEDISEAAVREVFEESGYRVKVGLEIGLYQESVAAAAKHIFSAEVVGGDIVLNEKEILDVKWLSYEEIRALHVEGKLRAEWIWDVIQKVQSAA